MHGSFFSFIFLHSLCRCLTNADFQNISCGRPQSYILLPVMVNKDFQRAERDSSDLHQQLLTKATADDVCTINGRTRVGAGGNTRVHRTL